VDLYYEWKNNTHKVGIEKKSDYWEITIGDTHYDVSASTIGDGQLQVVINGSVFRPRVHYKGQKRYIFYNGETYQLKRKVQGPAVHDHVEGEILSPIGGKIIKVFISEGDIVEKKQDLLIIESMKMEHKVKSPMKGVVMRLRYGENATVDMGEVLVDLEQDKSSNGQGEW
jgi:biotin carboxyl carrier protein